ncbi:MAG: 1-acyl-sn-glycerol-3-phosphate acyltransferase [Acidimicrobiia bacterium]
MKKISELWLGAMGWTFVGEAPVEPKLVLVAYPHTSNWDFFVFLAVSSHFGLRFSFLAHEGLFRGPLGWLLRRWGGIPVQGKTAGTIVRSVVQSFGPADELLLVIAPEGTRAGGGGWKSGFWRIAEAADVPVAMAFVDGPTKTTGFGPVLRVDGDPERWMAEARAFYADKRGLKPDNRGTVEIDR